MTNQDDSYLSTPVLIIGYSRISAIREQILQLRRFGISRIYLALDFANDPSLQQEQERLVNELLAMKVNPSTLIRVWYRTRNHGVAVGVLSALDWFFSENQYGVIVEDDLVYNLDFLKFCTWALKQYINSDEVLMISGNRYNSERNDAKLTGTNYPQIWGWASSDVKWAEIRRLILRSEKSFCNLTKNSNINYFYSFIISAIFTNRVG